MVRDSSNQESKNEWHKALRPAHIFLVGPANLAQQRPFLHSNAVRIRQECSAGNDDETQPIGERQPRSNVHQHATRIGRVPPPPGHSVFDDRLIGRGLHVSRKGLPARALARTAQRGPGQQQPQAGGKPDFLPALQSERRHRRHQETEEHADPSRKHIITGIPGPSSLPEPPSNVRAEMLPARNKKEILLKRPTHTEMYKPPASRKRLSRKEITGSQIRALPGKTTALVPAYPSANSRRRPCRR